MDPATVDKIVALVVGQIGMRTPFMPVKLRHTHWFTEKNSHIQPASHIENLD
jgi:hypothetical protein